MKPLLALAVALMLIGAVMLVAGFGAAAVWISVITVGERRQGSRCGRQSTGRGECDRGCGST